MPTGRFAPSPTGTFHVGNLRTALAAWLFARSGGSEFLLRFEDLDRGAHGDHERSQLGDLSRIGLDFDGEIVRQSTRLDHYSDAIADLTQAGLTYPCWCSRREIREAPVAPHQPPGAYPGTCRDLSTAARTEKEASGRPPALRLRADGVVVTVIDSLHGEHRAVVDDFVLQRGDGTPAYHLVVVVDDADQGVQEVVRADDLLESTPRHAHLQSVLGLAEPRWAHVPLVVDAAGERLAKRDGSTSLTEWEKEGGSVPRLVALMARSLGIDCDDECRPADVLTAFDPARIPLSRWTAPSP